MVKQTKRQQYEREPCSMVEAETDELAALLWFIVLRYGRKAVEAELEAIDGCFTD